MLSCELAVAMVKVFQPYAQFWLEPLIQLLVNGSSEGVHYLVVEVVVTMLTWAQTAIPDVSHNGIQYYNYQILCTVGSFYGFSVA